MKKIVMVVFVFSVLILIPVSSQATSVCPSNATPELQQSDPACYTSSTTTSTSNWSTYEKIGRHFVSNGCSWYVDCSNCSYPCNRPSGGLCHATFYTNTCGGRWCSNMGSPPVEGRWVNDYGWVPHSKTSTSTSYTCYKWKTSSWTECSVETGLQYADEFELAVVSGSKTCSNDTAATFQKCPICGIADDRATGEKPGPISDLCAPTNTATNPTLVGKNWLWTCTVDGQAVDCEAPNEEAGECNSVHNKTVWSSVPPESELCTGGTLANFVAESSVGPWSWDCLKIGTNPDHGDDICSASCFDFTTQINSNPFPWPTNGEPATVNVSLAREGMCKGLYSCTTVNDDLVPITGTVSVEIAQNVDAFNIPVECTRTGNDDDDGDRDDDCTDVVCPGDGHVVDHSQDIHGYCTARECNVQGTCQATPVSSSSYNGPACTSSCNSNADCSSGGMIETRP